MNQALLQMRDVSKAYRIYSRPSDRLKHALAPWTHPYRDHQALRGVTLDVRRGEAIGVIGRNGAGKSTLLQIAAGVLRPSQGRVVRHGRVSALLELGAGFNPDFTGVENARLAAALHGLKEREADARMPEILAFADLGPFAQAPVRTYSSGMRARLGFAVMMHVDGDVLIVDEALAVGDAAFRQKCMRKLRDIVRDRALLFVSHSSTTVLSLCDRAVWIDDGEVRADGPAKDVVRAYEAAIEVERSGPMSFRAPTRMEPRRGEAAANASVNIAARREAAAGGITVFDFDPEAALLTNGAVRITSVSLAPTAGSRTALQGGSDVTLAIRVKALKDLDDVIVGFIIRNGDALPVFGENTLVGRNGPSSCRLREGEEATAAFRFDLPHLTPGDYAVSAAVATGTMKDHVYHARQDEAVMFRVHDAHFSRGLVGIPMRDVSFRRHGEVEGGLDDAA